MQLTNVQSTLRTKVLSTTNLKRNKSPKLSNWIKRHLKILIKFAHSLVSAFHSTNIPSFLSKCNLVSRSMFNWRWAIAPQGSIGPTLFEFSTISRLTFPCLLCSSSSRRVQSRALGYKSGRRGNSPSTMRRSEGPSRA